MSFNLLDGELLVDGKPLGRLPDRADSDIPVQTAPDKPCRAALNETTNLWIGWHQQGHSNDEGSCGCASTTDMELPVRLGSSDITMNAGEHLIITSASVVADLDDLSATSSRHGRAT